MIRKEDLIGHTNLRFRYLKSEKKNGKPFICRQNSQIRTWVREPNRFSVSWKYGLYDHGVIDNTNAADWEIYNGDY